MTGRSQTVHLACNTGSKPLHLLGSEAATVAELRTRVEAERAEHSVFADPEDATKRGQEAESGWTVHVRLGHYEGSPGRNVRMPRPAEMPENDSFAE
jgi:hypothetical protein